MSFLNLISDLHITFHMNFKTQNLKLSANSIIILKLTVCFPRVSTLHVKTAVSPAITVMLFGSLTIFGNISIDLACSISSIASKTEKLKIKWHIVPILKQKKGALTTTKCYFSLDQERLDLYWKSFKAKFATEMFAKTRHRRKIPDNLSYPLNFNCLLQFQIRMSGILVFSVFGSIWEWKSLRVLETHHCSEKWNVWHK